MFKRNHPPQSGSGRLLLVSCLLLLATSARAQLIFEDGFEFVPFQWKYVAAWQEERGGVTRTEVLARGNDPAFGPSAGNTTATGVQNYPAIAMDAVGNFVVAWEDDADGNGLFQIHARGFHADGSQRFPVFTVNSIAAGQQRYPDIAMAPNGDFVVVWQDDQDRDHFYDIWGRGFNADGSPKWSDRRINSDSRGQQLDPAVGMAADGRVVVTWSDDLDNNGFYQILARGLTATGGNRLADFTVNVTGAGQQLQPDVAVAADGAFVVVWADDQDINMLYQVFGRGFEANGNERFGELTLNDFAPGSQYFPAVGMADDGGFYAAWADAGVRIAARGFNPDGSPRFGDLQSNAQALQYHGQPAIAVAPGGQFVVVWEELNGNGRWSVRGRPLLADGSADAEFSAQADAGTAGVFPVVATRRSP